MQKNHARNRAHNRTADQRKAMLFTFGAFVIISLLVITGYVAIGMIAQSSSEQAVVAKDGMIRISLAGFGPRVSFFRFVTSNKKSVRFFVVQSSDGVYHAAVNACEICCRGKSGYSQSGSDIVCNACRRHFSAGSLNEVRGKCHPSAIHTSIAGADLVIPAAELEAKEYLF